MKDVVKYIEKALKILQMRPFELAKFLGVTQKAMSMWRHEKRIPSGDYIIKIQNEIDKRRRKFEDQKKAGTFIPLLPVDIPAGDPVQIFNDLEMEQISIPHYFGANKNMVAVKVIGDSMYPTLPDGAIVIGERTDEDFAISGEVVLANYKQEYTIKRFTKGRKDSERVLTPDNAVGGFHKPITALRTDIKIIARFGKEPGYIVFPEKR